MNEMTGAEMVMAALADQGVECIFGYPGGAVTIGAACELALNSTVPKGNLQAHSLQNRGSAVTAGRD